MSKDFNKLLSGLDASELLELAMISKQKAEQEKKASFEASINKMKALAKELGLDDEDVVKGFSAAPVLIVQWEASNGAVYQRYTGEKGKLPRWIADFKALGKEKCLSCVVNNNQKGIDFVNSLFSPKP